MDDSIRIPVVGIIKSSRVNSTSSKGSSLFSREIPVLSLFLKILPEPTRSQWSFKDRETVVDKRSLFRVCQNDQLFNLLLDVSMMSSVFHTFWDLHCIYVSPLGFKRYIYNGFRD